MADVNLTLLYFKDTALIELKMRVVTPESKGVKQRLAIGSLKPTLVYTRAYMPEIILSLPACQ